MLLCNRGESCRHMLELRLRVRTQPSSELVTLWTCNLSFTHTHTHPVHTKAHRNTHRHTHTRMCIFCIAPQLSRKRAELKKKLRVTFVGEAGVDMGGLTKEWVLLLVR